MNRLFDNKEALIKLLIKQRCRCAYKRDKQLQIDKYIIPADGEKRKISEDEELLYSLFPPRKEWTKLGKKSKRFLMDSEKRNRLRLWYTYRKAIKSDNHEEWVERLHTYVDEMKTYIQYPTNDPLKIRVVPVEKDFAKDKNYPEEEPTIECRPICMFQMKDQVALSYLNKYLTELFDRDFLPCSYAFRHPTTEHNEYMHIYAIKKLSQYRQNHNGDLYVAECDMKKFYDTIAHVIIRERFQTLLNEHSELNKEEQECINKWMNKYLNSYNFYDDVYVLNKRPINDCIWNTARRGRAKGKKYQCVIKWVDDLQPKGEEKYNGAQRGIPQGGALSTLIANVVLHYVDKAVDKSMIGKDMLYLRFCDDMILVGINKQDVSNTFKEYKIAIRESNLFAHESENISVPPYANFWKGKTREPYTWGNIGGGNLVYPWVTFVGFDCNWKGQLRIRRKTLNKEILKQGMTVFDILNANGGLRCTKDATMGYIQKKLVAMSVGHLKRYNYVKNPNIHSWIRAFKNVLDDNPWSRKQMRQLDRCRGRIIHKAIKRFEKDVIEGKEQHCSEGKVEHGLFYGKPFSYYGQFVEYNH